MDPSENSPDQNCNDGIDIEGIHYTIVTCLFETGIFQLEDCTNLSDLELSDDTTDSEQNLGSPKKFIETINLDDYDSLDEIDRTSRRKKRGHQCRHASTLSTSAHLHVKKKKSSYDKRKKVKKVRYGDDDDDNYFSENSRESSYFTYEKRQLSPKPQFCNEVAVQEESVAPPQLFGYYFCEVCNLNMSSEKVYYDHMSGKRHHKNLKVKNVDKAVVQTMPLFAATEGQSKYPQPPSGVIRKKVKQRAKIQDIIKNDIKKPCPGLNLITEIQGLKETQYFCSICNSICSPNSILSHLTGFKHQLNLVKHFRPGDYEYMTSERKNLIQDKIYGILRAIERREGLGRMCVEVEELARNSSDKEIVVKETRSDTQEISLKCSGMSFSEYYAKATIPDKSAADFYCEHCDAHMNSNDMWQAHITGKRHITNLKKMPGDRPSKTKTVPLPYERAILLDRIKDECPDEPIVGLNEIREIQIRETDTVAYNCFLCCSCHTSIDIIEHVVSLKHRKKFLDHINFPYMQYISGKSEIGSNPIIKDICADIEKEEGSGKPAVHINKSAFF